jgi:hypothetical protein
MAFSESLAQRIRDARGAASPYAGVKRDRWFGLGVVCLPHDGRFGHHRHCWLRVLLCAVRKVLVLLRVVVGARLAGVWKRRADPSLLPSFTPGLP